MILLITGITLQNGAVAVSAFGTFFGGWISALACQCLADAAGTTPAVNLRSGDWRCKCGRVNESGRGVCPRCGAGRR